MQIGIPRESLAGETRVAATPNTVEQLKKLGFDVVVESGAGALASFDDAAYVAAGASVATSADIWQADIIYKVNAPSDAEIGLIKEGATLVSFLWPAQNPELVAKLSTKKINVLAMDMVPRISRAQSLDALSSMANIGGYRAVIEAAHSFGRFFTGQITAAGKVPPAKVLVIGAGPSGLSCAWHLNRLGHQVEIREAGPLAGGMQRFGIPAYRLPRDMLDREVARILAAGVTLTLNHKVEDVLKAHDEDEFAKTHKRIVF